MGEECSRQRDPHIQKSERAKGIFERQRKKLSTARSSYDTPVCAF